MSHRLQNWRIPVDIGGTDVNAAAAGDEKIVRLDLVHTGQSPEFGQVHTGTMMRAPDHVFTLD